MKKQALIDVQVTDVSGRLLPCRLHLKRPDGTCWLPPDVRDPRYTETESPDFILPGHYQRYLHLCQGNPLQSLHLTRGAARIPVPAERLRLFVSRGHEYAPVSRPIEVKAGETRRAAVVLQRRANAPAEGWYGGDMHTHFSRWQPSDDHVWARLLEAEDIHAVNNMVYKHQGIVEAPQHGVGRDSDLCVHHLGHHVVAGGEEFRDDNLYGHMIAAGIEKVIEPISVGHALGRCENYPLFASVCDWAHEQGGIAGWAHGGAVIKTMESLPIEAALGKLDFVENIQFNMFYGCLFWYRLLNCGIPLSCTGGSDFPFGAALLAPWYPNLGLDRTYVRVDGEFSYRSFIEGIRRGRSFATNGPLLFLEVDGQPPGAEIRLAASGGRVVVRARAVCNYGLDTVEIVQNGAVVHRTDGRGGQKEIECAARLRFEGSAWVAARARGLVAPRTYGGVAPWRLHAHTSPVYVSAGRRPIRVKADLTGMADYVRMVMENYRRRGQFKDDRQPAELMQNAEKAIAFYESRL